MFKVTSNLKDIKKTIEKLTDEKADEIAKKRIKELQTKDRLKGKKPKNYTFKKKKKGNEIEITIKEVKNPFIRKGEKW